MIGIDAATGFTLGLVGSVHCAQMCGPIVLAYSIAMGAQPPVKMALAHASYNAGRIATYSILGAAAGYLGHAMCLAGRLAGVENIAVIVAGAIMIIGGLWTAGLFPTSQLVQIQSLKLTPLKRLMHSASARSKLGLGLMLGFLPCGLIYAALMKATSTADPISGAVTMFSFGVGNAIALLFLGMFSSTIGRRLGPYSTRLSAASITIMGVILVWRGMMPSHLHH